MALANQMDNLLPLTDRKISVSFVSDLAHTQVCVDPEPPTQSNPVRLDPALKSLQQRILRLQVSQVVLGLTLMVLSSVAIIEDRVLFGLGFGLISALIAVVSAALGINQCNLRWVAIFNIIALVALFPSFFFVFENLIRHSRLYIRNYPPPHIAYRSMANGGYANGLAATYHQNHHNHNHTFITNDGFDFNSSEIEKSNNTLWILCWLELAHLVPLSASILYLLFLYRYLNYYTHF